MSISSTIPYYLSLFLCLFDCIIPVNVGASAQTTGVVTFWSKCISLALSCIPRGASWQSYYYCTSLNICGRVYIPYHHHNHITILWWYHYSRGRHHCLWGKETFHAMAASMQHYRFTLAYNGARYHGLQRQTKEVFASFQSQQPCQRLATPKATDQESVPLQKRRRLSKDAIPLTIQDFLERAFWMYVQSADSNNGKDDTKGRDSLDDSSPTSPVLPSSIAELRIRFAGRTDRGVHARGQVVTCFLPIKERHYGSLLGALNSRLPDDISLQSVTKVPPDFNPRKHPKVRKTYR